jgi:hypothetical protein
MTGQRNRRGWLRAESLIAGEREQYAVVRSYGRVVVELCHAPINDPDILEMPWVTSITITNPQGAEDRAEYRSFRLNVARDKFNELVRKHP